MAVFTSCSGWEFESLGHDFIMALNDHSPGQSLHIHIVNPLCNTCLNIQHIEKKATALTLSFELKERADKEHYHQTTPLGLLNYLKKAYCDVLYLDIHLRVRQSLFLFLARFPKTFMAYGLKEKNTLLPRVLWVRPKQISLRFLKRLLHLPFDNALLSSKPKPLLIDAPLLSFCFTSHFKRPKEAISDKKNTVAIIMRRIDLPFNKQIIPTRQRAIQNINNTQRLYWESFPLLLREAIKSHNIGVDIYCVANGNITENFIDGLRHETIYVPHKNQQQLRDSRLRFYMQELYPWFFTIDKKGWGPTHSKRRQAHFESSHYDKQVETLISTLKQSKTTKYKQTKAFIPDADVFFPLQVPDDESIRFGSPYPFNTIVCAVIRWAKKNKVRILFKTHPMAEARLPNALHLPSHFIKLTKKGNIHDILEKVPVVFVVNSSVGLEALLYEKPIVSFGKSIYDELTFSSDINEESIQLAYQKAIAAPPLKRQYLKWLSWYFFTEGINLTDNVLSFEHTNEKRILYSHTLSDTIARRQHLLESKTKSCSPTKPEIPMRPIRQGLMSLYRQYEHMTKGFA